MRGGKNYSPILLLSLSLSPSLPVSLAPLPPAPCPKTTSNQMKLILYSKPGCHLCEGLQEKLEKIYTPRFNLEIRDITSQEDWFQAYQYEVPVLFLDAEGRQEIMLPRPSPRATVQHLQQMLQKYVRNDEC